MFKRFSNEVTIDRMKSSLEINKVYIQREVEFYTVVYHTLKGVELINT
jgi:hypothetical protein